MHMIVVPLFCVDYFDSLDEVVNPKPTEDILWIKISGYDFPCVARICTRNPQEIFPEEYIEGDIETPQTVATIITKPVGDGFGHVSGVLDCNPLLGSDEFVVEYNQILDELEIITQFSGIPIELVVHKKIKMVPARNRHKCLTVVLGGVPPGYKGTRSATHFFGTAIVKPGYEARLNKPTLDVGYVVKNDFDEAIAQIVGNTIYLYIPLNCIAISQLVDPSKKLFNRAMTLAWNEYVRGKAAQLPTLPEITNSQAYLERIMNPQNMITLLREKLGEIDEEIMQTQRELTRLLAKKAGLITAITGTEAREYEDIETGWERLQDSPFLDSMYEASTGTVYYHTKALIIPDTEGKERYIGRLAITIEQPYKVIVWSLDTPHPGDIPHPHVNCYGEVCFGNVTQSVAQLLAEQKEAEVIVLIMRLLAEGYDDILTEHKVTEWPTTQEWERKKRSQDTSRSPLINFPCETEGDSETEKGS